MTPDPDAPETPTDADNLGAESDERFPSGPWTGFFLQPALAKDKIWMELGLAFRGGVMTGEGRDRVGTFLIRGRYEVDEGKCWWTKRYVGKHDVAYQGYNEGKGIWGVWELKAWSQHGGFHIWPVGMADPTQARLAAEADVPVEEISRVESPFVEPVAVPEAEPVGAGEGVAPEPA